jgi:hypothetical protein
MDRWMKHLTPGRKLSELCLPGSHDAGVYRDTGRGVNPGSSTRCQSSHIFDQALAGSRVFDIRVFLRTTGVVKKVKTPTMGHFFTEAKDGWFGDYGGTLVSALEDAALFLGTRQTEFLIFRISHTKCTGNVVGVLQQFARNKPGLIHTGANANLADLTVRDLKGKLLLVFDNQFNAHFSPADGYYAFHKYPNTAQSGLTFCGKYGGSATAVTPKGKGNWSAEGAVGVADEACAEHKGHNQGDHLFWVYWQETGGNVKKNTTAARTGMHDRLGAFLSAVKTNNHPLPNVIGHDFVKEATCKQIAKANPDLSNVQL